MSDHWNSDLLNKVLTKIEAASFFKDIGRDRTLSFVRESLRLARYHDGNPGEVLAGVGQRLGICYYCWNYGRDLQYGICETCRKADSIRIESDASKSRPRDARIRDLFRCQEMVADLLDFLPRELTADLDTRTLELMPSNCVFSGLDRIQHVREVHIDAAWRVDYLPGRRQPRGTPVLMIEFCSHPYPKVAERLRQYAPALSELLCLGNCVEVKPPFIVPVLVYNGRPAWTPGAASPWDRFDYTFIDVDRFRPEEARSRNLAKALFALEQLDSWSTTPQPWRSPSPIDDKATTLATNLMTRLSRCRNKYGAEMAAAWYEMTRWTRRDSAAVSKVQRAL